MREKNYGNWGLLLILLALMILNFNGCSKDKKYINELDKSVNAFWESQLLGRWHDCYNMYSSDAIANLVGERPETFKSAQSYALRKNTESKKFKLKKFKIVSKEVDKEKWTAKVRIGLEYQGSRASSLIEQNWIFNRQTEKWEISYKRS